LFDTFTEIHTKTNKPIRLIFLWPQT